MTAPACTDRHDDRERRSNSWRAFDADRPAVCGHDRLRDGETESCALCGCRRLIVSLEKLLEDVRDIRRRKPRAGIAHPKLKRIATWAHRKLDRTSTFCELEGIRQQVANHLAHPVLVPDDLIGQATAAFNMKANPTLNREHPKRRFELREKRAEPQRPKLELAAASLEPAHVQQLSHEARQRLSLRCQREADLTLLGRQLAVDVLLQQLQVPDDHIDWRLELVRRDRHELRFELVELFQLLRHRMEALGEATKLVVSHRLDLEPIREVSLGD